MTATTLPFSAAEYARRLERTRRAMQAAGMDVLFVEDPSNMAWLTGYDGWSFYVHQGVLVFLDDDPIWWGRMQDMAGAERTVWMGNDRLAAYPDIYVQSPERHPMQVLAGLIAERGHAASRIGLELDNYYFSAKAYLTLRDELPEATLLDATALVNWQRAVKSGEEIAFMRKAARIAEKMVDGIAERVEVGLPKNRLVADLLADAVRGTEDAWGDYAAIVPLLPSGADAAAPHLTWDDRPFQSGEATFFELAGCYRRYHIPFCRTVFLGEPPDHFRRAEAALQAGIAAGLDAARPGNRAGDIARALHGELRKIGIDREPRCGYAIGLSYPPDWGERTISLRSIDETVLEPDMTFHFMPGLWMDTWGLEITESIRILESGPAETFCDRPRALIVKR